MTAKKTAKKKAAVPSAREPRKRRGPKPKAPESGSLSPPTEDDSEHAAHIAPIVERIWKGVFLYDTGRPWLPWEDDAMTALTTSLSLMADPSPRNIKTLRRLGNIARGSNLLDERWGATLVAAIEVVEQLLEPRVTISKNGTKEIGFMTPDNAARCLMGSAWEHGARPASLFYVELFQGLSKPDGLKLASATFARAFAKEITALGVVGKLLREALQRGVTFSEAPPLSVRRSDTHSQLLNKLTGYVNRAKRG